MADGRIVIDTLLNNDGIKKGINGLKSVASTGLKATGAAIGGVSTGLMALGGYAVKVGASFEQGMSKVSAISGATGTQLDALTEKAKEMGRKTKFSATESAEAMQYMAMAGWKTGDMLNGIEGIMNLAAASGEDLASTSDIVTDALTAFGMKASDSGRFADVLAQASSNANTNVGMMGETFKYVAPVAGALGFSAEDTAVAIGLMANSGIKASQAGTSLRAMLSRLAKPTDEVQGAMEKLGVSLTDSHGNMKTLDTIMKSLREGFSGLSKAEQVELATSLAGQEAMSGLLAIVNASDDDFNKLKDSIYNCDGAAAQMAETMQDNLTGKLTILQSTAEGLGIELYESIESPLKKLAQVGIDSLNQLTEALINQGTEGLIEAGAEVAANLIIGMANGIPDVIDMAVNIIDAFTESIESKIPMLVLASGKIITSFGTGILTMLPSLASLGMNIITTVSNGIINALPGIVLSGTNLMQGFAQSVASGMPQVISIIQSLIISLLDAVISGVPSMITAGVQIITSLVNGISSMLPSLLPLALNAVISLANGVITNLPSIINAGINLLLALAQGIANSLPMLVAQVPQVINSFCAALDGGLLQLLAAGIKIIAILAKGIIQAIPSLIANLPQVVLAIYNVFAHINLLSAGTKAIKTLSTGIKNAAKSLPATAKSCATKIWNAIINTNWLSLGQSLIRKLISGIKALFGAASSAGTSTANGVKNAISRINWAQVGKLLLTKVVNGIKGMLSAAKSAAATIGNGIKAKFTSINWSSVGHNIINGIKSGIAGMAGSLMSAAKDVAKKCLQAAKNALGIHSPSTKFRDIVGKNIPKGIIAGIKAEEKNVVKSIESLSSKLVKSAQKAKGNYEKIGNDYVKKFTNGINAKAKDSIKSVTNLVNKNITALGKSNKKAKAEYTKAGKAVINAYKTAVNQESEKLISSIEKSLDAASKKAQEKYDEIVQKQSDMRQKIADYGDVYTEGRGLFLVGDLQQDVDDIKTYQQNLNNLKGKVPDSLMQEILGMDIGEANKYVAALNNLTGEAYNKYIALWNEKQSLSNSISKQYYKDDLSAVKDSYEAQVAEITRNAKASAANLGTSISSSFATALAKESKNMSKSAKKVTDALAKKMKKSMKSAGVMSATGLVDGIISQSKLLTNTVSKTMKSVVAAAKGTLKIKSPSRVFDEIGRFSIQGAERGTEKEGKNLIRQSGTLAENFAEQFSNMKFDAGNMIEKMRSAVLAEKSNMTLALTNGADYNLSNTTQIDWSNAPVPEFNGVIHTHVNLNEKEVGKSVTPVVSKNMSVRRERLR